MKKTLAPLAMLGTLILAACGDDAEGDEAGASNLSDGDRVACDLALESYDEVREVADDPNLEIFGMGPQEFYNQVQGGSHPFFSTYRSSGDVLDEARSRADDSTLIRLLIDAESETDQPELAEDAEGRGIGLTTSEAYEDAMSQIKSLCVS